MKTMIIDITHYCDAVYLETADVVGKTKWRINVYVNQKRDRGEAAGILPAGLR